MQIRSWRSSVHDIRTRWNIGPAYCREIIQTGRCSRGKGVKLSLSKPVKARRLVVSLIGEEWVYITCGGGKNRTIYEKNIRLHDESIELSGEVTYRAVEKDFQFRLPANAPQEIFVS